MKHLKYIRTDSGGIVTPELLTTSQFKIRDIAAGLSKVCRWSGQCRAWYPVAAHSIHVAHMVPRKHRVAALLHDASEAYIGDVPSPMKTLMPDYKRIENQIMEKIAEAFGFDYPLDPVVKQADAAALYLEREHLFCLPVADDVPKVDPPNSVEWLFSIWFDGGFEFARQQFLHEWFEATNPEEVT